MVLLHKLAQPLYLLKVIFVLGFKLLDLQVIGLLLQAHDLSIELLELVLVLLYPAELVILGLVALLANQEAGHGLGSLLGARVLDDLLVLLAVFLHSCRTCIFYIRMESRCFSSFSWLKLTFNWCN